MKSIFAGSIITIKLLTLWCFANMGLMMFDMSVMAQAPCHDQATEISEEAKDCDACVIALGSWSESYVETAQIEVPEFVATLLPVISVQALEVDLFENFPQVYRPPPQVVWSNAFHLPQKSTVLIV